MLYDPYSGETSNSLQDIMNGFRVITSSSIAEDSVVIILKVRTRVGGGISTGMITNEKDELERRKINKAEDKEPYNTESLIIGEEELEGYGKVLVKKDGCDDMPVEQQAISYSLLEQPEYFKVPHSDEAEIKLSEYIQVCNNDSYARQFGGSAPVDYKRYRYDYNSNSFKNSWILEPYKGIDDRVHYNFINPVTNEPTTLIFDFVTGVCYLKINGSYPPKTLIESLNDVNNHSKIPSNDYEQAFVDFCGHLCYKLETATYVLIEIIQIHKREHMNDFAEELRNNFPSLVAEIRNHIDLCDSYSETVRKNAEKVVYKMVENFIQKSIKDYLKKSGEPGSEKERKHERDIQKRPSVTNRIEDYKDALKMRFHQLVGRDCQKCSYE